MPTAEKTIEKGVKAALALAKDTPWGHLTLSGIAKKAGLKLSDFHGVADKGDLAEAVEPFFDKAMSAEVLDMDEAPRARLFEAVMLRFEAMEDHREALTSLMKWREQSPARLARMIGLRRASAEWALVCAGLDNAEGLAGAPERLKALNVGWAMAKAERAWRRETSPDFTRTMAALDKELRDAEERADWFGKLRQRRSRERDGEGWRFADENEPGPDAPKADPAS